MIDEIEADQFQTFILPKPSEAQSLNLNGLMLEISKQFNFSLKEFWEMPLFLVFQLLGMFKPPKLQAMSRKTLIDNEKRFNRQFNGY